MLANETHAPGSTKSTELEDSNYIKLAYEAYLNQAIMNADRKDRKGSNVHSNGKVTIKTESGASPKNNASTGNPNKCSSPQEENLSFDLKPVGLASLNGSTPNGNESHDASTIKNITNGSDEIMDNNNSLQSGVAAVKTSTEQYYNFINNKEFFIDAVKNKDSRLKFIRKTGPNLKSVIWTTFSVIYFEEEITNFVKCDRCDHVYKYDRRTTGTSTLNRHPCIKLTLLDPSNTGTVVGDMVNNGGTNGSAPLNNSIVNGNVDSPNTLNSTLPQSVTTSNDNQHTNGIINNNLNNTRDSLLFNAAQDNDLPTMVPFGGNTYTYYAKNSGLPKTLSSSFNNVSSTSKKNAHTPNNNNNRNFNRSDTISNEIDQLMPDDEKSSLNYFQDKFAQLIEAAKSKDFENSFGKDIMFSNGNAANITETHNNHLDALTSQNGNKRGHIQNNAHGNGLNFDQMAKHFINKSNYNTAINNGGYINANQHGINGNFAYENGCNMANGNASSNNVNARNSSSRNRKTAIRTNGASPSLIITSTQSDYSEPKRNGHMVDYTKINSNVTLQNNVDNGDMNKVSNFASTIRHILLGKAGPGNLLDENIRNGGKNYNSNSSHYKDMNGSNSVTARNGHHHNYKEMANIFNETNGVGNGVNNENYNVSSASALINSLKSKSKLLNGLWRTADNNAYNKGVEVNGKNGYDAEAIDQKYKVSIPRNDDDNAVLFWSKIAHLGLMNELVDEIKTSLEGVKTSILRELYTNPHSNRNETFIKNTKKLNSIVNEFNLMNKFKVRLSAHQAVIQTEKDKISREMFDLKRKLEVQEEHHMELYKRFKCLDELQEIDLAVNNNHENIILPNTEEEINQNGADSFCGRLSINNESSTSLPDCDEPENLCLLINSNLHDNLTQNLTSEQRIINDIEMSTESLNTDNALLTMDCSFQESQQIDSLQHTSTTTSELLGGQNLILPESDKELINHDATDRITNGFPEQLLLNGGEKTDVTCCSKEGNGSVPVYQTPNQNRSLTKSLNKLIDNIITRTNGGGNTSTDVKSPRTTLLNENSPQLLNKESETVEFEPLTNGSPDLLLKNGKNDDSSKETSGNDNYENGTIQSTENLTNSVKIKNEFDTLTPSILEEPSNSKMLEC